MVSCRLENREQEWKNPACENFIMGGIFFQKVTIQNIKNVPETTGTFFVKSIKRYRTNIIATAIRCPLINARNDKHNPQRAKGAHRAIGASLLPTGKNIVSSLL